MGSSCTRSRHSRRAPTPRCCIRTRQRSRTRRRCKGAPRQRVAWTELGGRMRRPAALASAPVGSMSDWSFCAKSTDGRDRPRRSGVGLNPESRTRVSVARVCGEHHQATELIRGDFLCNLRENRRRRAPARVPRDRNSCRGLDRPRRDTALGELAGSTSRARPLSLPFAYILCKRQRRWLASRGSATRLFAVVLVAHECPFRRGRVASWRHVSPPIRPSRLLASTKRCDALPSSSRANRQRPRSSLL